MASYELITVIIVITALFAYINYRFIRLPSTIGLMIMSLASSLAVIFFGHLFPALATLITSSIRSIDFQELLLDMMLSFLLFAGAIHIDANKLREHRIPVLVMASVGILISTTVIGVLVYFLFGLLGHPIGLIYCLLFGALISPTDPIAVLGILRKSRLPHSLELKITGESLFNDGVAIVVFLTLLRVAETGIENVTISHVLLLFAEETLGGFMFGLGLGYLGFYLLRSIDHYQVEVQITLAMVMGGYMLADFIHVSAPIAIVTAGIITGNKGKELAMSNITRDYLGKFWEIIDEILNAVLFLLIGFEMLEVKVNNTLLVAGGVTIFVVLLARYVSVILPLSFLRIFKNFENNAVPILTWGALRGGISVAIALSLPSDMHRNEFVTITYIVVVFSIIVQGLTIGKFVKYLQRRQEAQETS